MHNDSFKIRLHKWQFSVKYTAGYSKNFFFFRMHVTNHYKQDNSCEKEACSFFFLRHTLNAFITYSIPPPRSLSCAVFCMKAGSKESQVSSLSHSDCALCQAISCPLYAVFCFLGPYFFENSHCIFCCYNTCTVVLFIFHDTWPTSP